MSVSAREVSASPRRVASPSPIRLRTATRRRAGSLFLIAAIVAQLTMLTLPLAASAVYVTGTVSQSITLVSGAGSGGDGSPDPNVTYSIPSLGTTGSAKIMPQTEYPVGGPYAAYAAPISGSRWINTSGTSASDTGSGRTTIYSTTFVLPVGYTSPSIAIDLMSDNCAIAYLNGVEIGGQPQSPCVDTTHFQQIWAYSNSTEANFHVGSNTVSIANTDGGGPNGVDFRAVVTYTSAPVEATDFAFGAPSLATLSIAPGDPAATSSISTVAVGGGTGQIALAASVSPADQGVTVSVDPSVTTGSATVLSVTAAAGATPGLYTATLTGTLGTAIHSTYVDVTVSPPVGVPALFQAVPKVGGTIVASPSSADTVYVAGQLQGAPSTAYTIDLLTAPTCPGGALGLTTVIASNLSATTDGEGNAFFGGNINITPGSLQSYLAARVTGGTTGPCVVVSPNNDQWPYALDINAQVNGSPLTGYVDTAGRARWYKFTVQPGSRAHVRLTGLPDDYDVYLFKDIDAAYTDLTTPTGLTQLSAEFAGAFSTGAFSTGAFSTGAFSTGAFSTGAFSTGAFSTGAFSTGAFSTGAFSTEAYSNAQLRSLIGGSNGIGTVSESIDANTWAYSGTFYLRVNGKDAAASLESPFTLSVTTDPSLCSGTGWSVQPSTVTSTLAAGASSLGLKTLILKDSSRMTTTAEMNSALAALAARTPDVQGAVIDLATDPRIDALNDQADAHPECVYAKNLVAQAIKDVVTAYRAVNPGLEYVVLVGGDGVIPFFRYPDQTPLAPESDYVPPVDPVSASEASLRSAYLLGQDEYGASIGLSFGSYSFPVPDLAVGRLVETAAEITTLVNAYLATDGGVVAPNNGVGGASTYSSLVTGYDFLSDAACTISQTLADGTGATPDTLIAATVPIIPDCAEQLTGAWSGSDLKTALTGERHDLILLAGHFSSDQALAADFSTSISTADLSSAADLTNSIVFSIGCHSGYNLVDAEQFVGYSDPLDWAQAFAQKGATLIAGTGYQYGDSDFEFWSEKVYGEFAHQLRVGTGPVSVGTALLRSKQVYLAGTPDVQPMDAKALLVATLYGLPMLSVNLPLTGRDTSAEGGSIVGEELTDATGGPGAGLGLASALETIPTPTTTNTKSLANVDATGNATEGFTTVTWLTGNDGVAANPGLPVLPLKSSDVSVPNKVLRGVGFWGGNYSDTSNVVPLTGAPATELATAHVGFASPSFAPELPWRVNYFDAFTPGGRTSVLLTPAQYRSSPAGDGTSTLRSYSSLDLQLFYSANIGPAAQASGPSIAGVSAVAAGPNVTFQATVTGDPDAGVQQVWVTYTGSAAGSSDEWQSILLTPNGTIPNLWSWTGPISLAAGVSPANIHFMVQAANGVGVVTLDNNFGANHRVIDASVSRPAPAATTLALDPSPVAGVFGSSAAASATLASGGTPLVGYPVTFTIGGSSVVARTSAGGIATASIPLVSNAIVPATGLPAPYALVASFAGDDAHKPSSVSHDFRIHQLGTSIALTVPATAQSGEDSGVIATLTDAGLPSKPIPYRTVFFVVDGPAQLTLAVKTDATGRAPLGVLPLRAGTYSITACFVGPGAPCPAPSLPDPNHEPSSAQNVVQVGDTTAPTAGPTQSPAANDAGWNNTDVTVTWNWTDEAGGSGIDTANCPASSTSTGQGSPITLSATCKDLAGNTGNNSYNLKVDKTKPTLSPVVSPNPILLNGAASINAGAADTGGSGMASVSCGALDTSSVGFKSVTCTASDNAGNTNSATVSYQVIWPFAGFFQPVDALPTLNIVKAGSAVPVKFSLSGNRGLAIMATGYPVSTSVTCGSTATDTIEETVTAGSSSLSYDTTTDRYNYVWKSDKAWANTCRTLTVKLIDGTLHQANFKFTK